MAGAASLPIDDQPEAREVMGLEERLGEFNEAITGIRDGKWLTILSRNDAGAVVAGLHGWTWGGCCYINSLWVAEGLRRQGWGRRLLDAGEAEAARRGCRTVFIDTFSFQAPTFYAKQGYRVVAEVDGYPAQSTRVYLRKDLAP